MYNLSVRNMLKQQTSLKKLELLNQRPILSNILDKSVWEKLFFHTFQSQ